MLCFSGPLVYFFLTVYNTNLESPKHIVPEGVLPPSLYLLDRVKLTKVEPPNLGHQRVATQLSSRFSFYCLLKS